MEEILCEYVYLSVLKMVEGALELYQVIEPVDLEEIKLWLEPFEGSDLNNDEELCLYKAIEAIENAKDKKQMDLAYYQALYMCYRSSELKLDELNRSQLAELYKCKQELVLDLMTKIK